MCLHAGADQSQGVTGKLTAGAGHSAAGQQDQHARVGAVSAVLLQVVVLQRLRKEEKKEEEKITRIFYFKGVFVQQSLLQTMLTLIPVL